MALSLKVQFKFVNPLKPKAGKSKDFALGTYEYIHMSIYQGFPIF